MEPLQQLEAIKYRRTPMGILSQQVDARAGGGFRHLQVMTIQLHQLIRLHLQRSQNRIHGSDLLSSPRRGGTPRPKRTPLSELKGFAREARLRERRRLETAYTSKRGYFRLPPGEKMKPLKRARMEVRHYQTSQEILIPPLPFARFVREISTRCR